jgi:hypothetical protein
MNQYGGAAKVCDEGNFKVSGGVVFGRYRMARAGQGAGWLPGAGPAMDREGVPLGDGLTWGLEGERCIAHEDTATGFG